VIKGPGSSLYGAGTGGVVLLKSIPQDKQVIEASATTGSFGLVGYALKGTSHNDNATVKLQHSHLQSDGYRNHTAMVRDVFQGQAEVLSQRSTLSTNFLYSDLYYQTPGGLNLQQYINNPRQSRPAGGPNPGAAEQKAGIFNRTFYAAIHHQFEWNEKWSNQSGVYGSFTDFKNPAIRNFERRNEQSFGARTSTTFQFKSGKLNFGAEFQREFSPVSVYDNLQGITGDLQSSDEITTLTYLAFVQTEFFLPNNFFLTVGASVNKLEIDFTRLSTSPPLDGQRNFDPVLSPRVALLAKLTPDVSAYASYSLGYSPPSIQELYPSTGIFDTNLDPEKGRNTEVGVKAKLFANKLKAAISAYTFNLDNTIVTRTDDGAEYFVNAGKTSQRGLEASVSWQQDFNNGILNNLKMWSSYTLNDYIFKGYRKDTLDLSGKQLTGIPPHVLIVGADLRTRFGLYLNATFNFTDELPLNDENTVFATGYKLLGGKVGYQQSWRHFSANIFVGIDNALDVTYSLGNDLNAFGGRYYNAAPGINYFTGFKTGWIF
jgi:iron complex outermembrane recepter protein